jgi:hypothetical protein
VSSAIHARISLNTWSQIGVDVQQANITGVDVAIIAAKTPLAHLHRLLLRSA